MALIVSDLSKATGPLERRALAPDIALVYSLPLGLFFWHWTLPMGDTEKKIDQFSEAETKHRFEAALRGARIAGPKHNESLTPKRVRTQRKKRKKAKA